MNTQDSSKLTLSQREDKSPSDARSMDVEEYSKSLGTSEFTMAVIKVEYFDLQEVFQNHCSQL